MSNKPFPVPGEPRTTTDTPSSWSQIQLLGSAHSYEGVTLTHGQDHHLRKFYGIDWIYSSEEDECP